MKIRDILLPASLAILSTFFVQNLVNYLAERNAPEKTTQYRSGQSVAAPKKEQLIKQLLTEVDFLDADLSCKNDLYTIQSERLAIQYSRCGAAMCRLTSNRIPGEQAKALTFIDEQPENREKAAFMVALNEKTPLDYQLIEENDRANSIAFRAKTESCTIEKEFKFYQDSYKVDLRITIDPHTPEGVQPRILVPSPYLRGDKTPDTVLGIMFNDHQVLDRKKPEALENNLWVTPTLFGSEDRYFIMALVADPTNFVQRAYFKVLGVQQLAAILEGPLVQQKTSWDLSFYCGPKQIDEINRVDSRLETTLDYGWFGPISKVAMRVLNMIYSYVHNYGWAIILLTILIKLLLVPFTIRAEKSAKKAGEMKKKLNYIEQKYKHDPETLAREKADLIKKHGVFDIGCLSIFVQLPIVLALNRALSSSIELYKAPFIGWIHDLSAIDPYYVVPAFCGLGIFLHSGSSVDPRQKMVTLLMALIVSGIMMNLAVGLVLFIAVSTWLSVIQAYIQKALKV